MSQSDYIKYKRIAVELKSLATLPSVIGAGKYTDFKEFSLENTVTSNKIQYNKLLPENSINVFGMEKPNAGNCAPFALCYRTDSRTNRHPIVGVQRYAFPIVLPKVRKPVSEQSEYCRRYCERKNNC
jgi:hypothetical protein